MVDHRHLTVPERLASLETELQNVKDQQKLIMDKLDALLAFKHKGLGALALIAAILGSSVVGAVAIVVEWVKGVH
jgi:hypothetical protein